MSGAFLFLIQSAFRARLDPRILVKAKTKTRTVLRKTRTEAVCVRLKPCAVNYPNPILSVRCRVDTGHSVTRIAPNDR